MNKIYQIDISEVKNTAKRKSGGFTLIELLVVVLITGILAAVALPQYQTAVRKGRYMQLVAISKTYKDAFERYYMANGEYPKWWADLDISMGSCTESTSSSYMLWCPDFSADMYVSEQKNLRFYSWPYTNKPGGTSSGGENMHYIVWLDNSKNPGRRFCTGTEPRVCKSLGGVPSGVAGEYLLP